VLEGAPEDSDRLDDGPVWARLFTPAIGRDADLAWAKLLGEFVGDSDSAHASVPVRVYPNTLGGYGGDF
jgi:hypothetical protein